MAMSGNPADGSGPETNEDLLARAARSLREITDDGWVQARDSVLARVLRAVRPSQEIAGQHEHGTFTLAADILTNRVRAAVDQAIKQVQVTDVRCAIGPHDQLESVVVVLSIRFGTRITNVAATTRATTAATVSQTLGTSFRTEDVTLDLHIADVHPPERP
jgi:hypothetical protein